MKKTMLVSVGLALGLAWASVGIAGNGLAPKVLEVDPSPDTVSSLTYVSVRFSEPVSKVDVTDLLLNGRSIVSSVTGSGDFYTFYFSQQPPYGLIRMSWDPGHDIQDLDDEPSNRLNENDPDNSWEYDLVDATPPTVAFLTPAAGTTVRTLSQIEVVFSEAVVGVDAGDLLVNGAPSASVSVRGVGRYLFQFPQPANGMVQVAWTSTNGIMDFAAEPNGFAGGSWTYTLDPTAGLPTVRINEFLAANVAGLKDEDADASDWIELWNYGSGTVNLSGFSLTDDPADPGKWIFPSTNLAPGRFLVVFASGKDRRALASAALRYHTNFKLNRFGNYLALFNNESPRVALTEFAPEYPEQRNDYSYGFDPGQVLKHFTPPTPGGTNAASAITGMAPMPHVNVERGFFDRPFTLIASAPLPGGSLRYTIDGSEPTALSGQLYTGPLQITNTTVLRIAAFATDMLPSRTETHTYFFPDQVLRQPNNPPGYPVGSTVFTGYPSDYEMDPEIVTNAPSFVKPSLLSLPSLSIAIKIDDMFGPTNGIYTHPEPAAAERYLWERACSVEYILTNGQTGFQVDCGIRIQGNASRTPQKTPKHPFRLFFRGDYGPGRLEYPLFPDAPIASFDTLVLRADFNNSWVHWDANQRSRGSRIRDAWTKDSFGEMNGLSGHCRHFHLYINGLYWGVYDFGERIDANFAASYLGGTPDQYDAIASKPTEAIDGDLVAYNQMVTLARSTSVATVAGYTQLKELLDLPTYIDYMLLNFYGANNDWGRDGNWNAVRRRVPPGPVKYVPWDGEQLIVLTNDNHVTTSIGNDGWPSDIYPNITNSAEFRLEFADRAHRHLFNGGALTPEHAAARWMKWAYAVEPGMLCESARWGDYRRDVHSYSSGPYEFYRTNTHWWPEINRMRTNYFPQRGGIFLTQLRNAGLYPAVSAPVFSQHGGRVARGFALSITASNDIYLTTDGSDPRVYGTGEISANARRYTNGVPVVLTATTVVKARARNGSTWSALNEANFIIETLNPPLRATEIMYNPIGGDAYEFIELQNVGATSLDVSGFSFSGITFIFPVGTVLAPGQVIVLGSSAASGNWTNRYPGVTAFGQFDGSLANGGEKIAIKDARGQVIYSVDYDDENGWPTAADGLGYSLEVIDPFGDPDDPANWHVSLATNGTPGVITAPPVPGVVLINELMASNMSAVTNDGTLPDWIELYNPGSSAVDLADWSLTDSGNPRKFVFPPNTSIPAGGYLVVWCDAATNTTPGLHAGFALDNDGETVFLFDASTSRVDAVTFGLQVADFTVGRVEEAWALTIPTPNAANLPVTNLISITNLVVNEWLANPLPGGEDWIELYNPSADGPIALRGVYLSSSNTFYQIQSLSFVAPGGFAQFIADEQSGPNHLDFRLPATGGTIGLYDETATECNRAAYGVQQEDVTQGRLPDGAGNVVSFPGTPSPGAPNYLRLYGGPVFNEIMAVNHGSVRNAWGEAADWVELINTNDFDYDLTGFGLSDNIGQPGQWVFPAGATVPAEGYLVIWFDDSHLASIEASSVLNTGRALSGESGAVYLSDQSGHLVDTVAYGFQVEDLSIGCSGGQWRLLASPTPGAINAATATLASPTGLRLNEWMANPLSGDDWFEIYNSAGQPVELSGLFLTDDPSSIGLKKFELAPLSFIGAGGFVRCVADDEPGKGSDHVNFALDAAGETLSIYSAALGGIDTVFFGAQDLDVAQGRLPDGASNVVAFPTSPTPAESNHLPLPNAVINEVLTHSDNPLEDAIEIHNPSGVGVNLGGWYLSNSDRDLKKYRIPDDTILEAGGYAVLYQAQFGVGEAGAFTLSSAHGDAVYLAETDALGNLTGYRTQVRFGAAANGVSLGRFESCSGSEFVPLSARTFGVDAPGSLVDFRSGTGLPNAEPVVGPVVLNELMYHPPDLAGTDNTLDEYVELHNRSTEEAFLFDPAIPENTWRLRGGVSFRFPEGTSIPSGGYLLVVNFDPTLYPEQLDAFRVLFSVPADVTVLGPYQGKLDNGGERIELQQPDAPQPPAAPDAGFVPYLLADAVAYSDAPPWPVGGDGDGASLQRDLPSAFGNDANNWSASAPTAGRANVPPPVSVPVIVVQPVSRAVRTNSAVIFSVSACGTRPLSYQWRFNGTAIPDETNSFLRLVAAGAENVGTYSVMVANSAGAVASVEATLELLEIPFITDHPLTQRAYTGTNLVLRVSAGGTPPLSFQWFKDGLALAAGTNADLALTDLKTQDSGSYMAVVSNPAGSSTSAVAVLTVVVPVQILQQPISQKGPPGTNVTFVVSAIGTGTLRYQWRFNGDVLPGQTDTSLSLTNAQLAQNGDYAVEVSDDLSTIMSSAATLTILVRPVITVQPVATLVMPGNDAVFFVEGYGTLPISFRWRRGGSTFTNGIIINSVSNSTLIVTNVPAAYDGNMFTVALTNIAGQAPLSTAAQLSVFAPPVITIPPTNQAVEPGTNVTFVVGTTGGAPLRYQWWFNEAPIVGKTNTTLTLTGVQAADEGSYFVVVTNRYGSVQSPPAVLTVGASGPPRLSAPAMLAEGGFQLWLEGSANRSYEIQVTTNFMDWALLGTVTYTNGPMLFLDSTATNSVQRFYRARLKPAGP